MTVATTGTEAAQKIAAQFPEAVVESNEQSVRIRQEDLVRTAAYLKTSPELAFNYLADMTATDYLDYFELVYQLVSMERNRSLVLKMRVEGREKPQAPSVMGVWRGADLMEREIFDLFGIVFTGRPGLERIFLWEGFSGYPLRKDYL
jgi:NADH-quinone oxidoreductase subunit C